LAQQVALVINAGVAGGTIIPSVDTDGPPPTLPGGTTGEYQVTGPGLTILPAGYSSFITNAPGPVVVFGSGDPDEKILSGSSTDLSFIAPTGSGTVVAGGGNNFLFTGGPGNWSLNTGNGDDFIAALGTGNNTVAAGTGHNTIALGAGSNFVNSLGSDTIIATGGTTTINAAGGGADFVQGGASNVFFVGGASGSTVFGGSGSDTLFGGSGNDYLVASSTTSTLNGGAGADTIVASSGADTVLSVDSTDVLSFIKGQAGGSETVLVAPSDVHISLSNYGPGEAAAAIAGQTSNGAGGTVLTLSDGTKITFDTVSHIGPSNFT
jgi:Ca2+-binding RTX toxin-like protein